MISYRMRHCSVFTQCFFKSYQHSEFLGRRIQISHIVLVSNINNDVYDCRAFILIKFYLMFIRKSDEFENWTEISHTIQITGFSIQFWYSILILNCVEDRSTFIMYTILHTTRQQGERCPFPISGSWQLVRDMSDLAHIIKSMHFHDLWLLIRTMENIILYNVTYRLSQMTCNSPQE